MQHYHNDKIQPQEINSSHGVAFTP